MKHSILIRQHDITDCGAACLASVCAYYGLKVPVARIRQYAYTDQKGTNILGMTEAAQQLGLNAKGVKGPYEALPSIPIPAIALVVVKENLQHYIVIYKVNEKKVTYMDPADGKIHKIKRAEFEKIWTNILIILQPSEFFDPGDETESLTSKLLQLLVPHKSMMFQALFGALIYSILGLATSVYIGKITDYVLVDENTNLLNLMSIIMIAILVLRTFIGAMKSILALKTGQRIDAALILGYYRHLLYMPQQFFDTMRVGEIISRVNDAVKIRNFINNVSLDLMVNMMILGFTIILMFAYSWQLALVTLASAPLFYIIFWGFNKLNKKYQRRIMESSADLESQLVESLNSISTIKQFGIEEYASIKTENRFVKLLKNTFRCIYGSIIANNSVQFISTGVTIAVLWIGSTLVIDKSITPGTLMLFYSLIGYVISPISSLISANPTIQDALIAADRLFQIMDLNMGDEQLCTYALEPWMIEGGITFNKVTFWYGSRKQVFNKLSLKIEAGQTTAIVGESGSGKTTLVSLIQHLYPLQDGEIYFGSHDIVHINMRSLRIAIASVPQHIELFAGTVVENIALGYFHPDMKKIDKIVEQLGLKEFIERLPDGYQTIIGEHGASLSGGERQRIAIARALYKNPSILIFDEATSSLDSTSERYVKKTLDMLAKQGKTIIIIAHRLSTIKNADHIFVLDKGKVAESGTHKSLLSQGGIYSRLWHEQFDEIE